VNAYLLHQPAPLVPRAPTAHRDAISPQHTRTATVFTRLLERLPPVLAEKYVLPWAGGTPRIDRLCAAVTSATARPARKLAIPPARSNNLAALCREAMRQAWQDGAGAGGSMFEDAARRAVAGLTGENAADCLAVLASARPVDRYLAAQLLAVAARQPDGGAAPASRQAAHRWLPFLASTVRAGGTHVQARPGVPGAAVGRLVRYGPDGPAAARHEGAILLVDRPLPPQAPLLLAARGVISRAGAGPYQPGAGSGRGVPTVTACDPEIVTGGDAADGSWLAAIDGATGEVALLAR
jgi:hypothetical protein